MNRSGSTRVSGGPSGTRLSTPTTSRPTRSDDAPKPSKSGFVRTGRIAGTSPPGSTGIFDAGRKQRRREKHPGLAELVDWLREREMGKGMKIGLKDDFENFGIYDYWSDAVPVTFSDWTGLKHRKGGKPRGKSVNHGNKEWMND